MKNTLRISVLALTIFSFSCSKDDAQVEANFNEELLNIGNNVIVKTYEDLKDKAALLQQATLQLEAVPNAINLSNAKNAWVAARSPWEQSEGFLFGPVDQQGIDPSIDSWPVNVIDLNNVLNSPTPLTVAYLANQEGYLKGFHTIEFLLWGANGNKQVSDFTAREFEFLKSCAANLATDTNKLYNLWAISGDKFILNLTNAGSGSQVYISQKSALVELTNKIIGIADEVANGKINDPFSQNDVTLEESSFSANSKTDFIDNIKSIQNIYLGTYSNSGNGSGISSIVVSRNATLDAKIKSQIIDAIMAIQTIEGSFTTAVLTQSTSVTRAQGKIRTLKTTLESELMPLINSL